MGRHMEEWARKRRRGALNTKLDALASAILADAEEADTPDYDRGFDEGVRAACATLKKDPGTEPHPYYWRPWETRPRRAWALGLMPNGWVSMVYTEDDHAPPILHWMPLPPEPTDD